MPAEDALRQMEVLVADLRGEFARMRDEFRSELRDELDKVRRELGTLATQIASTQTQSSNHIAVCDERQRLMLERQRDHDNWARERDEASRDFMASSTADRAAIHKSVELARIEVREATIKILRWVIGLGVPIFVALVASWVKSFGLHI